QSELMRSDGAAHAPSVAKTRPRSQRNADPTDETCANTRHRQRPTVRRSGPPIATRPRPALRRADANTAPRVAPTAGRAPPNRIAGLTVYRMRADENPNIRRARVPEAWLRRSGFRRRWSPTLPVRSHRLHRRPR